MKALNDFIFVKLPTRKSLFAKTIKRDDGTEVELILSSTNFLGNNVTYTDQASTYKNIMIGTVVLDNKNSIAKIGDTAIVDSMIDENDEYVVSDKEIRKDLNIKEDEMLVCISAVSKFYKKTKWTEGRIGKAQMEYEEGETMWGADEHGRKIYENKLIAVERGGKIINNKPFKIVEFAEQRNVITTLSGLVYKEASKRNITVKDIETGNSFYIKIDSLLPINGKKNWFFMEERDILAQIKN